MQDYGLTEIGRKARKASRILNTAGCLLKNKVLVQAALALEENQEHLMEANAKDVAAAEAAGMKHSLIDRLKLTPERIKGISEGLRQICLLYTSYSSAAGKSRNKT